MLLAAAAAVLVVAAPAQAKIPSGEGWSARRTWGSGEDLPTGERELNARVSIIDGTGCVTGNLLADNLAGTGLVCSPAQYTPIPLVVPVVGMFQAQVCVEPD